MYCTSFTTYSTYNISKAAPLMQPSCNVIRSYVITNSAGESNLDSARNFTSHYGVKTIVVQVVTQFFGGAGSALWGVPRVNSSSPLMIQRGALSNPRGVNRQNRARQAHVTEEVRETRLQEKRLQRQTTRAAQEDRAMWRRE